MWSPHRVTQLLLMLTVFWVSVCAAQQQTHQSGDAGCSAGPAGTPAPLSGVTPQQLAAGGLVSSVQNSWDFGIREGSLKAAPDQNVALACVVALNASVSRPTASVFLQPTAIDVSAATGLVMENVLLSTNCSAVLEYQAYFCSTYNVSGSLTLQRGTVHFSAWEDGFSSLRNVTLTCPGAPEAAPLPPCWLAAVGTDAELLDAFRSYADGIPANADGIPANLTIVISGNITINNGSWPADAVQVSRGVVLVGSTRLYRPVLDLNLLVALWELLPAISVSLVNLTCANLAPTYISPVYPSSMFALLTERVWAFRRTELQLYIVNSTLVVPEEELLYMTHWLKYLTSPVPEDQAKAAWLNVLDLKISKVNASGIYYDKVVSYTAAYTNVLLTDALDGYPLLPVDTGLQMLTNEEVPLSAVRQVVNTSDLLVALSPSTLQPDGEGRRWLFLVANLSLTGLPNGTAAAAGGAVQLPGSTVVVIGAGLRSGRLDFGPRPNVLTLAAGSALVLRSLLLGDLPPRATVYNPQSPLDVLLSPLWGVAEAGTTPSGLDLTNCTLLVSRTELRLLQQCLLPTGSAAGTLGPSVDAAVPAALRAFFSSARVASYNTSYLQLASGAAQRYTFANLTFRTPVAAEGEAAVEDPPLPPAGDGSGGAGGLEGWQVGVIVGCVVGGLVLLALLLGGVLAVRRRRGRQSGARLDDAARRQGAYEKYLRSGGGGGSGVTGGGLQGGGAPGGACTTGPGGSSDLVHPSHELTNSSRVLRPDARRSDLEAAAALEARLKAGSGTASASGGIGTVGRSMSTTGVTSQDTSSGAVLPSVGVSCAAVAPVSSSAGASGSASASASGGVRAPAAYERPLGPAAAAPPPPAPSSIAAAAAAAAAAAGPGHVGHSQVTDSFERPPSNTALGQHGPAGRHAHRLSSVAGTSSTPSSVMMATQSIMATGGAGALDQMHQMIQVLGREFNDKQLEVYGMLGKGAHGTVYRGTWRGLPVAVKSMVVSNDSSARQQSRVLMEAAISSSLAHPNIVTTYAYELREVEHELASISPELARQGGGWRLLIIQEYCDAGPLRRLVDCGFFLTPPKPSGGRPKLKLPSVGLSRKDSPSGEGSVGSTTRHDTSAPHAGPAAAAAASCSRASSGSSDTAGNGSSRAAHAPEAAATPAAASPGASRMGQTGAAASQASGPQQHLQQPRPALDSVPSDVPPRPASSLQAARRYVEAALMVARGLQHIHDKNIVHGDLNPNNVLLMRAPGTWLGFCLKVADFGLSVRMAEGESHMSNLFQGSPYYCAPEVVLSGKIGKSADIYSLGIMLWELQSGTRPLWRSGVRLRSYPSLNTAELDFGADTPPRYVRLTRDCFHASKDARPGVSSVVEILEAIKAELEAL